MQTIGIVATSGKDAAVDVVGAAHGRNPAAENAIRAVVPDHPPSMGAIVKELYIEQGIRGFFKVSEEFKCLNTERSAILFSSSSQTTQFSLLHRESRLTGSKARFHFPLVLRPLILCRAFWRQERNEGCVCPEEGRL